jgi:hypothetical protein
MPRQPSFLPMFSTDIQRNHLPVYMAPPTVVVCFRLCLMKSLCVSDTDELIAESSLRYGMAVHEKGARLPRAPVNPKN